MPFSIQEIRKFLEIIEKNLNKENILKILPVICVIIGTYFLLNSTEIGLKMTRGGNTDVFLARLNANTETYRIFGGILLAVGLIRLLQK